jgi:hypothetical protein
MKMEQCSEMSSYKIQTPGNWLNLVIIYLLAYEDGTDSVPKRRHIKFRRRGITQKKTYNLFVAFLFQEFFNNPRSVDVMPQVNTTLDEVM